LWFEKYSSRDSTGENVTSHTEGVMKRLAR
jgi:hypothetical protein